MSQNSLSPHDPKFTAYALGELDPAERAAVEAALRDNPAARAAVEQIRAVAAHLSAALAEETAIEAEAAPAIPYARAAIIAGRDSRKLDGGPLPYEKKSLIKFPQFYYISGLAAAACFAVFVAFQEPRPHPPKQIVATPRAHEKVYTVLNLDDDASNVAPSSAGKNDEERGAGTPGLVVPGVSPEKPGLGLAAAGLNTRIEEARIEQTKAKAEADPSRPSQGAALAVSSEAGQRPAIVTTGVPPNADGLNSPRFPSPGPGSAAQAGGTLLASAVVADAKLGSLAGPVPAGVPGDNRRIDSDSAKLSFSPLVADQPLTTAAAQAGAPLPVFNTEGVALSSYEVSVGKDGMSRMRGIPAGPASATTVAGNGAAEVKQATQLTPFVVATNTDRGNEPSSAMK
ncbi:MAG: hypothetical protein ABIY47_14685, partial [Opitutaceae bacterium]